MLHSVRRANRRVKLQKEPCAAARNCPWSTACAILAYRPTVDDAMPKIDSEHPTARFAVRKDARTGKFVLENRKTGKRLPLKGYGTLGDDAVPKDIDLTRPIYEQVMSATKKAKSRGVQSRSQGGRRK